MTRDSVSLRIVSLMGYMLTASVASAYGETCNPPNVARVVEGMVSGTVITTNDAVLRVSKMELACPPQGYCRYIVTMDFPPPPKITTVCLTPAEHEAAEARGR